MKSAAAANAALLKERERLHGLAAVILNGQIIDRTWMQTVLAGHAAGELSRPNPRLGL